MRQSSTSEHYVSRKASGGVTKRRKWRLRTFVTLSALLVSSAIALPAQGAASSAKHHRPHRGNGVVCRRGHARRTHPTRANWARSRRGVCVRAAATCTLAAMKAGLWSPDARKLAGTLYVADIGMPAAAWERCGLAAPTAVVGGALLPV